jgi:two-component system response regulator FixJ
MSGDGVDWRGKHMFLVEDNDCVAKAVSTALEQVGLSIAVFHQAGECLGRLRCEPEACDILIVDVRLPGMDGIELLTKVKHLMPSLPVIIITAYGDVPMAVKAFRAGASDFLEKPLRRQPLLSAIESALKDDTSSHAPVGQTLTRTELEVLRLILQGKNNKEIARLRHRAVRTVEDEHRHIMRKLGVNNLVDLVKRVAIVRMVDLSE